MPQFLVFAAAVAVMLGWVWLFGLLISGNPRQATAYFRSWWRVVKWMALAGGIVGLIVLQLIPAP